MARPRTVQLARLVEIAVHRVQLRELADDQVLHLAVGEAVGDERLAARDRLRAPA